MCKMNVLEAKTNFSKLLSMLENKEEDEIIICRSNKPVAKLTWMSEESKINRIRQVQEMVKNDPAFRADASMSLEEFDSCNDEIAKMFGMIE